MKSQKLEQPSFFIRLRLNATKEEEERYNKIKTAYQSVVDSLEHPSSRKLCQLGNLYEMKLMELVQFPHRAGSKTLEEKAAHIMAEIVIFNMAESNQLGAKPSERRKIYLLLKDLGVKEENIMLDTISRKIPYDEKRNGIISVKEEGEFKSPEAVAYARLYEKYLNAIKG
ncbi:MAG: hypothetical protein QXF56_00530 [Candidatus Micrarchaeia archaeon]